MDADSAEDDDSPGLHSGLVFVGILLACMGACTSGFGMNLMKASSRLEAHRPLHKRYRWILGASLACCVNTSLDIVAFALAPLSLIAPIGGLTIVVSVLVARLGIVDGVKETVSLKQWMAIGGVVGGVACVNVFGPHPDPQFDTQEVLSRFHRDQFVVYQLVAWTSILMTYVGLWRQCLGSVNMHTCVITAVVGGLCSGITQTMMKVLATCAAAWFVGHETPFALYEFWIAVVELTAVAFILLHMLNLCLRSAPMAIATSFYQGMVILCTIVAGSAFYGELVSATGLEVFMFILGACCVLFGLAVLVVGREGRDSTALLNADARPSITISEINTDSVICERVELDHTSETTAQESATA